MIPINILDKFNLIKDPWKPGIVAELNDQQIKLAKVEGEFVWHDHKDEDELFYVLRGELTMEFRDKSEVVKAGEMIVVPRGVEHRPVAKVETWILLFEPKATKHTGDVETDITVDKCDYL